MVVKKLFKDGKRKAVTFSFDDGTVQDLRLMEIFKKYGLKGTFNLNSGIMNAEGTWFYGEMPVERLSREVVEVAYTDFEIAIHGQRHIRLDEATDDEIFDEVVLDRIELEKIAGYPVQGMVCAFGSYTEKVLNLLRSYGVLYNRGIQETHDFEIPTNFLEWHPTCHYADSKISNLVEDFIQSDDSYQLFYIWGHSYELDGLNNWDQFESTCRVLSQEDDIWFASNGELYQYIIASEKLVFTSDQRSVYNPSRIDVWLLVDGKPMCIEAGFVISLKSDIIGD